MVGGGSGTRFGRPKQYETLGDERVLDRSCRIAREATDGVVIVVPAADAAREGGVAGGSTRSESVRAGLAAVPADADIVCVHDAARPFATPELYEQVVGAIVDGADGAIPGIAVSDTIKIVDDEGAVCSTPDRAALRAVQTPQAFRASVLREAHGSGIDATDDAALVETMGGRVVVVDGDPANFKITLPDDLERARRLVTDAVAGASERM